MKKITVYALCICFLVASFYKVNADNSTEYLVSTNTNQQASEISKQLKKLTQKERDIYLKIDKAIKSNHSYIIADFNDVDRLKNRKGSIKYDINKDGKIETLSYEAETGENEWGYKVVKKCKISIDKKVLIYEHQDTGEVAGSINSIVLADVNSGDNYVDFYIVDGWLSDRQINNFYVFKNNQIYNTCNIESMVFDVFGNGNIYYWEGCIDNLAGKSDMDLILFYYDYNKRKYIVSKNIIGRKISFDWDIYLYRLKEDVICGAPVDVEEELSMHPKKILKTVKVGEQLTILSIDGVVDGTSEYGYCNNDNGVKVRTKEGKIGWIGGFHMVWD